MDVLVLWLLPASWFVHDVEEVLTIEGWSDRWVGVAPDDRSGLQYRLVEPIASSRRRFTVAVALVGCVVVGATVGGVLDPTGTGIVVYAATLGGYFLHGFVHLGQSVVRRGYTPGLVAAATVVIPVSACLYRRLVSAQFIHVGAAIASGAVGIALVVPIVLGANTLADRIERRRT